MVWIFGRGLVFLMMVFCGPGEAVKCYLCSTKENELQCLYPKSYDVPLIKCDLKALENTTYYAKNIDERYDKMFQVDTSGIAKNIDLNCLKVVTKHGEKNYTFRGCQLAEHSNLDICFKMETANTDWLQKQHCSRCSMDGCNTASVQLGQEVYHLLIMTVSALIYRNF